MAPFFPIMLISGTSLIRMQHPITADVLPDRKIAANSNKTSPVIPATTLLPDCFQKTASIFKPSCLVIPGASL